jgi:hypothetical protein
MLIPFITLFSASSNVTINGGTVKDNYLLVSVSFLSVSLEKSYVIAVSQSPEHSEGEVKQSRGRFPPYRLSL